MMLLSHTNNLTEQIVRSHKFTAWAPFIYIMFWFPDSVYSGREASPMQCLCRLGWEQREPGWTSLSLDVDFITRWSLHNWTFHMEGAVATSPLKTSDLWPHGVLSILSLPESNSQNQNERGDQKLHLWREGEKGGP